jgi:CheY-like chemotaxis protein
MEKRNCSILIIDDDQGVAYTARMILKQQYTEVKTESNPVSAFEQVRKSCPDIIILDMNFRSGATSGECRKELQISSPSPGIKINYSTK